MSSLNVADIDGWEYEVEAWCEVEKPAGAGSGAGSGSGSGNAISGRPDQPPDELSSPGSSTVSDSESSGGSEGRSATGTRHALPIRLTSNATIMNSQRR